MTKALDHNWDVIKIIFDVLYNRVKDVVTAQLNKEHDPKDAKSGEEVNHLWQTNTLYLSHNLAEVMLIRARDRGMPPSPQARYDSDSPFPAWWTDGSDMLIHGEPMAARCGPYVNPHTPVHSGDLQGPVR